ncbi:MAG: CDP-diacylglycerol--glycerol-3-phosphate 3-phosphatidyltransferase [Clostridia bacterium]|nr:CDP-diacylglycerol--glycerol-3-phosphate 3-phosphatidyltransferase [Clostridia bacterium]
MKLNLPTKLTVLRLILIPFCMISIIYSIFPGDIIWRIVAVLLFVITSFTDMLDGKIARKYNLVTDLGKFLDPLADKMLVIGVLIAITVRYAEFNLQFCRILGWALFVIILREMSVTLLRMIAANKEGIVISAAWLGKVKTTVQMTAIVIILLEPLLPATNMVMSYIMVTAMLVLTLWSGINYFKAYIPVLKSEK